MPRKWLDTPQYIVLWSTSTLHTEERGYIEDVHQFQGIKQADQIGCLSNTQNQ